MKLSRTESTRRRHKRIRRRVFGTAERPRLAIFRSNNHIYAQVIDDAVQQTLASASSLEEGVRSQDLGANKETSNIVGKLIAERSLAKGIQQVVFDRGGNLYHGRVAALADAAREAGLDF
jgi:large subunit ribosomal protein L18